MQPILSLVDGSIRTVLVRAIERLQDISRDVRQQSDDLVRPCSAQLNLTKPWQVTQDEHMLQSNVCPKMNRSFWLRKIESQVQARGTQLHACLFFRGVDLISARSLFHNVACTSP